MSNDRPRRGVMFVISSPSGAGKTTLCHRLISEVPGVELSISATTRAKRPNEVDGVDYHFRSVDQFKDMIDKNAFIEWAKVFDHYYGTPRQRSGAATAGRDRRRVRCRLAGRAGIEDDPRRRCRLGVHPAAIHRQAERAVWRAARALLQKASPGGWPGPARTSFAGANTTTPSSTTISTAPSANCAPSFWPNARAGSERLWDTWSTSC